MAGTFALNTSGIPGLEQVSVAMYDGTVYDFLAQKSGSTVVVADVRKQAVLRTITLAGVPVHIET